MIIDEWLIYWVTRLDGVQAFFIIFGTIGSFAALLTWVCSFSSYDSSVKLNILAIALTVCGPLLLFLGILTPSTKDALFIFGVPMVINSQQEALTEANKLPVKLIKRLNDYLDEKVEDKE